MMKFWNKRNRIEFFHNEPSIIDNFPIIESKQLKLKWVKNMKKDFQYLTEESVNNKQPFDHLSRCPGIFDLFKHGYIISLHKDIIIRPGSDDFEWETKVPSSEIDRFKVLGVPQNISNLLPKPPWAKDFIVKINTGWNVIAPKGIKFIMLPIAYPDTYDFTATTGILNPAVTTSIIFQMFWNGIEKEAVIQAGTPLGHLIPLSEKKYQMVQRIMNQHDHDWVAKLDSMYGSTFWNHTIIKKMIDMYTKYWKR